MWDWIGRTGTKAVNEPVEDDGPENGLPSSVETW
jgi:hypothetical protein